MEFYARFSRRGVIVPWYGTKRFMEKRTFHLRIERLCYNCHCCINAVIQACVLAKRDDFMIYHHQSSITVAMSWEYTYFWLARQNPYGSNHKCPWEASGLRSQKWLERGIKLYLPVSLSFLVNVMIIHNNSQIQENFVGNTYSSLYRFSSHLSLLSVIT